MYPEQAMAGHEDVVRYLVESGALPVDSGPFTPLMAVMTRRCTLSGHSASRMYSSLAYMESKGYVGVMCAHARDGQTSAQCENTYRQKICQPLLGMAQLLIELGADASAAHRTRGCLLAIAASAGKWGLWEQLIRDAPDLASGLAARCHAGRVLLAAMYSYLRDSDQQFLGSVIAFLQSSFAARGQQQRFLQQIRTPLKAAADIPGIATEIHALFGGRVHALCLPLLMGTGQDSADAVQQLLQAGVPVAALKLGRQHYQLACPCSAENVLSIIQHAVAGGDADQCGEILVGLLCQCCPPCDNRILVNAEQMAEALGQLAQAGVDFRQQRWWPRCFGSEYTRMWPMLCQNGVPISPLVFACGTGGMQGAKGMVAALQQMDQQGWAQWVSAPVGPHGDAALLTALYYGHHDILRYLLDARATLTPEQHALVLRCLDHWHEPCAQVSPLTQLPGLEQSCRFCAADSPITPAQAAVSEMRAYLDKHIGPCTHCRWVQGSLSGSPWIEERLYRWLPYTLSTLFSDAGTCVNACILCRMYARCRRCARCQKAQYCSRPCQSRAWKAHKQTCMAVH